MLCTFSPILALQRSLFTVFLLLLPYLLCYGQESLIDSLKKRVMITGDENTLVRLYNDIAWEYSLIQYDSAVKYTDMAIEMADKLKDPYWQGVSKEMKAILYDLSGRVEESIGLYLEVIAMRERSDSTGLENTYNNIAVLFKSQNNHQKALEYFNKSYDIERKRDNKEGIITSLNNMAVSLRDLGNPDSAYSLNRKAYSMAIVYGFPESIVFTSANLAKHLRNEGQLDSALWYNANVVEKARELEMYGPLSNILQSLADIYMDQGDYQKAILYLEDAEVQAKRVNVLTHLRDTHQRQSRAYAGLNDHDRAYYYLQRYVDVNDSVINDQTISVINELEKKYQTAKKDQNIAELSEANARSELRAERQASTTRSVLLGAAFLFLLTAVGVLMLRQRLKNQKEMANKNAAVAAAEFKQHASELEMKALRAQMNPHFIFNCMNHINRMVLANDTDGASMSLAKLSTLIRLLLENSAKQKVSLEDELSMITSYIELELLRYRGHISYSLEVDETIEKETTYLPSMLIQPVIENAIWHGLMHRSEPGVVNIRIREEDDILLCVVEDNGIGREAAARLKRDPKEKKKSMGLQITEARLKILGDKQKEEWVKVIDLKNGDNISTGTRVELRIPIS